MSELFPCPNPACTNWNPAARTKCFRCGHSLVGASGSDVENPGGRHPLLLPGIIAGVLVLIVAGYFFNAWKVVHDDKKAPVLHVSEPTGEVVRTAKDILEIRGTVEDLTALSVSGDGQTVDVVKGQFFLQIPASLEEREVTLIAKDKNGNESQPHVFRVAKDGEVPTITEMSALDGSVAVTKAFTITGAASEPIASASVGSTTGQASGTTFTVTVDLKPGEQTLAVRVTDLAGNVGEKSIKVSFQERQLPEGVTPGEGGTFVSAKDGAAMVIVGEGSFSMGTDQGDSDERPAHDVKLSPFLIDVNLVTNAQYLAFCAATGRGRPANPNFDSDYLEGKPSYPVVNVAYEDAKAYAAWTGRRLPTEAEWEKAARGMDGRMYPWGNEPPTADSKTANFKGEGDGFPETSPVGSFPAGKSPYGLFDMAGNVWQWVIDPYDAGFYKNSPATDPDGPAGGSMVVLRGGAFTSDAKDCRSTNRNSKDPDEAQRNAGFRTAADLQ